MPSLDYEYEYTVKGWKTSSQLVDGDMEYADSATHELTMKASMKNYRRVNFYYIRLVEKTGEVVSEFTPKTVKEARELFTALCRVYKLNHQLYNPQ